MAGRDDVRISVVVPAHNEAAYLGALLASLDAATRPPGLEVEVVVVDDASTDDTARVAEDRGARCVRSDARNIAAARNAGAAAATGDVLAFVDADMRVHPRTLGVIASTCRRPDVVGGVTGVRYERWSAGIAATYATVFPVVRAMGVDAGVVFLGRQDFVRLGGFDTRHRIAEDVDLQRRIIRLGRSRGQRFLRVRGVAAVASTRKFDALGDWHAVGLGLSLLWGSVRPRHRDRVIDRYWYDVR